ncbi:MAG: YceD family protein [Cyanobacteria bacterium J06639_1]
MLRPIRLPELLQAPNRSREVEFRQIVPDFPSLTPVEGTVTVEHRGTFLIACARVKTIVTLACHRCLQNYNEKVQHEFEEILWLEAEPEEYADELEVATEDLVERINPDGSFDVENWLYQQLWLAMPQQQLCSEDCQGLTVEQDASDRVDSRWAKLQNLREQLL